MLKTGKSHVFPEALNFTPSLSKDNEVVHKSESVMGYTSSEDSTHNVVADVIADSGTEICAALTRGAAAPLAYPGWGDMLCEVRKLHPKAGNEVDILGLAGLRKDKLADHA